MFKDPCPIPQECRVALIQLLRRLSSLILLSVALNHFLLHFPWKVFHYKWVKRKIIASTCNDIYTGLTTSRYFINSICSRSHKRMIVFIVVKCFDNMVTIAFNKQGAHSPLLPRWSVVCRNPKRQFVMTSNVVREIMNRSSMLQEFEKD